MMLVRTCHPVVSPCVDSTIHLVSVLFMPVASEGVRGSHRSHTDFALQVALRMLAVQ